MAATWEDVRHRLVDSTRREPRVPSHWPKDKGVIKVDCWRRKPWLPPRFGQALKGTTGGTVRICYVTPAGKLHYNKADLENGEKVDVSCQSWLEMDGLGRRIEWVGIKTGSADSGTRVAKLAVPKHWPDDSIVDPDRRASWLPASWGQGVVFAEDGRCVKYYVSPDGRHLWHKKKIEKIFFRGKTLPILSLATNGRGDPVAARPHIPQGCYRLLDPTTPRGKMLKRRRILQPKHNEKKRKAQPAARGRADTAKVAKKPKRCKPPGQLLGCSKCRYLPKGCTRCKERAAALASADADHQEAPLAQAAPRGRKRWRALQQRADCDAESLAIRRAEEHKEEEKRREQQDEQGEKEKWDETQRVPGFNLFSGN